MSRRAGLSQRAQIALTGLVGALALAAGLFFALHRDPPVDGKLLLALTLPDTEGVEQPLAQWKGKVLIVNFWATWCAPCREEMPEFVKAQNEFRATGVQFVGIGVDEAPKLKQFAQQISLNYPALVGGFGALELSRALGNKMTLLPYTIILDRDGKVAHTQLGLLPLNKLRGIIQRL